MQLTRRALESHGTFHLVFAQNAQEAFQRLQEEVPDLILMDLGLPDSDGLDVTRRLREEDRTRWVPVIILTGRSTVVDKITGLEVGADDYLTKPFDPGELVARVAGRPAAQAISRAGHRFREQWVQNQRRPTPGLAERGCRCHDKAKGI